MTSSLEGFNEGERDTSLNEVILTFLNTNLVFVSPFCSQHVFLLQSPSYVDFMRHPNLIYLNIYNNHIFKIFKESHYKNANISITSALLLLSKGKSNLRSISCYT